MKVELNRPTPNEEARPRIVSLIANKVCRCVHLMTIVVVLTFAGGPLQALAQGTGITLFGDVKVDDSKVDARTPLSLNIILYNLAGNVVGRQAVPSGGRYRFNNMRSGEYDLAVEVETSEIARIRVSLGGTPGSDFRQDLEFEWNPTTTVARNKAATISAADVYARSSVNASIFRKAQEAVDKKKYQQAIPLFRQIVEGDPQDFQAWTELGTAYLLQDKPDDAEKAYRRAIEVRPAFALALLNLSRLLVSQKKFEAATEPLIRALELQPQSAEANFLLGETYLQSKKGSKAVGYFNEAAKLGRYEAHLRLATLYNAAGMKDKAVIEYEEFLKKQPNYPDRKKLEQYIGANKKTQ
jgi:tetratricopeptide (TPR) repeat protein